MEDFFWRGRGGGGGANGGVIFRSTSSLHLQRRPRGGGRVSWNFPSFLVRATAGRFVAPPMLSDATPDTDARQIADPPYNWGYSKPVVVLDVAWNSLFVLVSAAVLLWASRERPETPIRAWVLGYAVQCLLHVGFVCCEYSRRLRMRERRSRWVALMEEEEEEEFEADQEESRAVKKLESLNAIMSLFWWMLGFYWIVVGGQALLQDAPRLYWLTVVFLAFDMFFAVFCVMLACAVGIALCCCLPCLIAFFHAIVGQEGASDTNLSNLPRFRYCQNNQLHKLGQENENEISITIAEEDSSLMDLCLPPEDSECCICLSNYEDGVELHSLPCNHYFHSDCIVKWLKISATCPLCKFNILRGS
ncbi:E3 ubiquitin protein ligase RIE1-like [Zingiber officinale]|uniref:E3 ubiquitin protein ligase RIE1-like n=1 Tax=Zingiber officinale TaxID=94328 RepID=UPI001C4D831D|nr:E3 ubiquitin protein ligase RIE1-like [Zingiber officinale]